jgi:hypothetical protein
VKLYFPTGWKRTNNSSYIQYSDPNVDGRWIRYIVNNGKDAEKILTSADGRLPKQGCEADYQQVGLRDAQLAGQPGSELEYLCTPKAKDGTEPTPRHGLWRAVAVDGKVYQVYLSTTEADFETAKPVFEQVAGTLTITG